MLRQNVLCLLGVEKFQVRLGDGARSFAIDVGVHHGHKRLGPRCSPEGRRSPVRRCLGRLPEWASFSQVRWTSPIFSGAKVVVEPRPPLSRTACADSRSVTKIADVCPRRRRVGGRAPGRQETEAAVAGSLGIGGVMTSTPGLTRSGQSLIPLGLPLRTTKTMVEKYASERFGKRSSQPSLIGPCAQRVGVGLRPPG